MRSLAVTFFAVSLSTLAAGCDGCSKPQAEAADGAATAPTLIQNAAPLNVTPLPVASIATMVNPQRLPAYAGPFGSVEGTITVTGDPAPETDADFTKCPDARTIFGRAFLEGTPKEPGGPRPLADAVVVITGYAGFYVPEKDEAEELTITGCGYTRRTVAVTFGQRLEVKNQSSDFWTPLLDPGPNLVMTMATPNGDPAKLYPKKPGRLHVVDFDRRYAVADLFVFLHSLHATSDRAGHYRIDGVPVGKLKVHTSHPRISGSEDGKDVTIHPGVVAKVDLALVHQRPASATSTDASGPDTGPYHPPLH